MNGKFNALALPISKCVCVCVRVCVCACVCVKRPSFCDSFPAESAVAAVRRPDDARQQIINISSVIKC